MSIQPTRGAAIAVIGAAAIVASALLAAPAADAEVKVESMGKGIVGLGLLSGEIVLSIEALAGVKNPWALSIPPIVAAGGGAVGGYFIDKLHKPEASVALLVSGMALFIPAIIIAVAKTKYVAEDDLAEDVTVKAKDSEKASDAAEEGAGAPEGGGTEVEGGGEAAPSGTQALLDVGKKSVKIGVPPLYMGALFSDEEMRFLARSQGVEYRLDIISVSF